MNRGLDPNALPALMAMGLLLVDAIAWFLRGQYFIALCWLAAMAVPYLLRRWGRS